MGKTTQGIRKITVDGQPVQFQGASIVNEMGMFGQGPQITTITIRTDPFAPFRGGTNYHVDLELESTERRQGFVMLASNNNGWFDFVVQGQLESLTD